MDLRRPVLLGKWAAHVVVHPSKVLWDAWQGFKVPRVRLQSEAARFAITGWETLELGGKSSVAGTHGAREGGHLGSNQAKIIPS